MGSESRKELGAGIEKKTNFENVVLVERPEAHYRIIYEAHDKPHSAEIADDSQALAVEFVSNAPYDTPAGAEEILKHYWFQHALRDMDVGTGVQLRSSAERRKMPVYLIDIADTSGDFQKKRHLAIQDLKWAEIILGTAFLGKTTLEVIAAATGELAVSKRDFLKLMIQGIAGAYLSSNYIEEMLTMEQAKSGHPKESSALRKFMRGYVGLQEKIHPEVYLLTLAFRNAVFSLKIESIAKLIGKKAGEKPDVALLVGGNHVGVEHMLTVPTEERVKFVSRVLRHFNLPQLKNQISKIAKLEFVESTDSWKATKIWDDPLLQEIT